MVSSICCIHILFKLVLRFDSIHTHGTGCTLSSVIASALAIGHQQRSLSEGGTGANRAIYMIDACCLAKAYVTEGVRRGVQVSFLYYQYNIFIYIIIIYPFLLTYYSI